MFQLINRSNQKSPVWLVDPVYTIGTSNACAVLASGAGVNDTHANIEVEGERVSVKNLVGDRLVLVNGRPVVERSRLHHGDELIVGDTLLTIRDPKAQVLDKCSPKAPPSWFLLAKNSALMGRSFPIVGEVVFGRAKACDISLSVSRLSRRHAKLYTVDQRFFVEDLDSSNGTFVNGERIEVRELKNGDELQFDNLCFSVAGPS